MSDLWTAAARLVDYFDADSAVEGPEAVLANRPNLGRLVEDLRQALLADVVVPVDTAAERPHRGA